MISLIVGLGNPGGKYASTRHNAGFDFMDKLLSRYSARLQPGAGFSAAVGNLQVGEQRCWLLRPETFMNRSGQAVQAVASYYRIAVDNILVAHDELDLPPGAVRLKQGGGHGGHNGLRDIIRALGSGDFLRLRIGIGHPGDRDEVVNYVLTRPSPTDRVAIEQSLDEALAVIPQVIAGNLQQAMLELHSP